MPSCCGKFALVLAFSLLLFITVILLFGILGLSSYGIVRAQNDDREALTEFDNGEDNDWFYYIIGATGAILPFSVCGTATMFVFIELIKACRKKREVSRQESNVELHSIPPHDIHEDGPVHGRVDYIDQVHNIPFKEFKGAPLAPISLPAVLAVFLSLSLSTMALMCIIWGIGIAYDNARRVDKSVWPYIVVEAIVGLVMPTLIILSAIIFAVFLEYITQATVDARVLITRLFPIIKLVKGERHEYWTISDRFYFQLNQHDIHLRNNKDKKPPAKCIGFCSHSPSTWILTIIVALSFLITTSYFMNENITAQSNLQACPHESRIETDCFNQGDFSYINCNDPDIANATNFTLLHCFKFLRFGQDSDVIGSLSRSFAFYLSTIAFFTTAFHIVNILLNFQPSRYWGIGFVLLGALLFIAGLAVVFSDEFVAIRLDVIKIFQLFMGAIFIMLVGLLLLLGKWWERVYRHGNRVGLEQSEGMAHKEEWKEVAEELKDEDKKAGSKTRDTHV